MNRKIKEFESVVSFRLSGDEKKKLDELIKPLKTTKSEFFRQRAKQILLTQKK